MVWYLYLSEPPGGEPVGSLQVSDRFPGGIPGLQWQWQANPHPETRLRPAEGNGLNLTCGYAGSLW